MTHEVYIARHKGVVVYVGEGVSGRHAHLYSGVSHVIGANLYKFSGIRLDIEVFPMDDKGVAQRLEKELILKHNPKWNRDNSRNERRKLRRLVKIRCGRDRGVNYLTRPSIRRLTFMYYLASNINEDKTLEMFDGCLCDAHLELFGEYPSKPYNHMKEIGYQVSRVGIKQTSFPKNLITSVEDHKFFQIYNIREDVFEYMSSYINRIG